MYKENLKQEHFDSETLKYILTLDKVKCNKSLDTLQIEVFECFVLLLCS